MPFRNQNFDEKFAQDFGDNVRNRTHSSSGPRFFNDTPGDFRSSNSRSTSEPPEDRPMGTESTKGANQTVKSHVRQIPIFVEGRAEPVLAHDFTKEATPEKEPNEANQHFPGTENHMGNKVPTFARPSSFNKPQKDVEIKPEVKKTSSHNKAQRSQPQEQCGQASIPQPEPEPQQQQQQPQPQRQLDSIEKIQMIQKNVLNLINDVERFRGDKNDKTYLYLDEMLTRNLLCLDNIDTEGKENIRKARKEAIKCIQSCINLLEKKATSGNDPSEISQTMNEESAESANEPANTEMRAVLVSNKEMDVSVQDDNQQPSESNLEPNSDGKITTDQQPMELENHETRAVLVTSNTCPLEENRAVLVEDEHAATTPTDVVVNAN